MRPILACTIVTAVALALSACGGGDKAGGSGQEVTLRVGTADTVELPTAKAIAEFARHAEQLSDGKIRIETVARASEGSDYPDQQLARMVSTGKLDGGMIPARAWDTEGVTTLRPLTAPFLLTSEDAVAKVVTGDLAPELLSGLDAAGVVGLALVPEGLRHPFGYKRPLVGREDYREQGIRTPRSETSYALFRALGAEPRDLGRAEEQREIRAGRLAGADTSFALSGYLPATVATGNVTFFPKVNSLVISQDAWEDLSEDQRSQLREAAERTRDWALEEAVPDAEAAEAFCERGGGRVVLASPDELDALAEATRPVYADLERDERTAALIDEIRAVMRDAPAAATPAACESKDDEEPGSADDTRPEQDGDRAGIPDGVYRTAVSVDELVENGLDLTTARDYDGVHTLSLRDGKLEDFIRGDQAVCHGTYESTAKALELKFQDDTCSGGLVARWMLRDGTLRLTDIHSSTPDETAITRALFGANPFEKID
jgi:TRAP-type C4-dicarboxylate transport system substrate-binding protein